MAHAREVAPEECCGILVGRRSGTDARVHELVQAANVADSDRRRRFLLEPRTQLRTEREARERGLIVIGFYHSHPQSPPEPSCLDRELAWPGHIYLICSPQHQPQIRAWRLDSSGEWVAEQVTTRTSPKRQRGSLP